MRDLKFPEICILGDLGGIRRRFRGYKKIWVVAEFGKSGVNGVAVARNGLIFGEDGAAGSRKVSGWLRELRNAI